MAAICVDPAFGGSYTSALYLGLFTSHGLTSCEHSETTRPALPYMPPSRPLLLAFLLLVPSGLAPAQPFLGPLLGPSQAERPSQLDASPADGTLPPVAEAVDPKAQLRSKQTAVKERLRLAQRQAEEQKQGDMVQDEATEKKVEQLSKQDVLLAQLAAATKQQEELQKSKEDLTKRLDKLRTSGPEEKPPYKFSLLDKLSDSLAVERDRLETAASAVSTSQDRLERARRILAKEEQDRRQAKEQLEQNSDAAKTPPLSKALKIAELESEAAKTTVELREKELQTARINEEVQKLATTLLEEKLAQIRPQVQFTKADLDERRADIKKRQDRIEEQLQLATRNTNYIESQWSDARRRLEAAADPTPALRAEVDARVAEQEAIQRQKNLWTQELEHLGLETAGWRSRYKLATEEFKSDQLAEQSDEVRTALSQLRDYQKVLEQQVEDDRKAISALATRIDAAKEDEAVWLRRQSQAINNRLEAGYAQLTNLDGTIRLYEKIDSAIVKRMGGFSLQEFGLTAWRSVKEVWNREIASSGDSSITVGKVILGILLGALGLFFSRRLSRTLGRRVLPKFGVEAGPAAALESLAFYALLLVSALMALRFVNVPLTIFTFLGGAVAIGVGFGSQNIVNNFISGLILLTERPIRVGDIVEVGELAGTVKAIGMRSTRVITGANLEIILPNSSLLENNVVNWTLSDSTVRCCVPVGVAYGSPTRDVQKWLRHAADHHGLVLNKPDPFVWFVGFGESSLDFELHFFIMMRSLAERKTIESDIRHMIDGLLKEAGIVIAFPQRDIHLDTSQPLEVRMVPPEPANEPDKELPTGLAGPKAA